MCGICGIVEMDGVRRFSEQHLQAMADVIRHRGPDEEGKFISGPVGLAFRRLSIIDLVSGHQPMANEDASVWIIFNGEIYNHGQLRPVLERRGHRYSTNSDTETILHLYEDFGEDCVHYLRGMFAFAIWDTRRKLVFCARDRLGIKPFYYTVVGTQFVFGSEIKALLECPNVQCHLNLRAIPEFLAFGYLSSDQTLFDGIHKLMPGHSLRIELAGDRRQLEIKRYWELDITRGGHPLRESEYVDQFRELFADTVRLHLMSDVPLGVFLSGGLDSSSIAVEMAALRKDRIRTFSVGYAEDEYSELSYARMVAKHIGSEHHEVIIGPDEFYSSLPELIRHEDEPLVWPSSVALYYVSRRASENVKVVLTGEGGDEIFAGYLKYRATLWNMRAAPIYRKLVPQVLQRLVKYGLNRELLPDVLLRKLHHSFLYYPDSFEQIYFDNFYSVFPQEQQRQLLTRSSADQLCEIDAYANSMRFFPSDGNATLLDRLLYLDIKTYLVELLMKQDQMSMATSLESRVPFLDHKIVEFAAQVPPQYKIRLLSGKYLLRRVMRGRLPEEILKRTKKGFPTPVRPWLRNQLFDRLSAILTDGRMSERGLIRQDFVQQLLEAHRRGCSHATEGCWRLLNFELWNRIFIDHDDRPLRPKGGDGSRSCQIAKQGKCWQTMQA